MKHILIVSLLVALSACASVNHVTPDQKFATYRAELKVQRGNGEISAVREQELTRDRYWQLFGRDSESAGQFAYSTSLMRSAEAGRLPMPEAQALVDARLEELLAAMEPKRFAGRRPFTWDGDTLKNFEHYEY